MKTTRELLELAARAAGVCLHPEDKLERSYGNWGCDTRCAVCGQGPSDATWYPLTNDGDCARLEAALGLDVVWDDAGGMVTVGDAERGTCIELYLNHKGDKQAARRMATLQAAAMIGEKMG